MPGKRLLASPGQQQTLLAQLLSRPMPLLVISANGPHVCRFLQWGLSSESPSEIGGKLAFRDVQFSSTSLAFYLFQKALEATRYLA